MDQKPLHWSEKARLRLLAPSDGSDASSQPPSSEKPSPSRNKTLIHQLSSKTLWIAVSTVIVAATVLATVFFWYLPSRDAAQATTAPVDTATDYPADGTAARDSPASASHESTGSAYISEPGVYKNTALGCSFSYPVDWVQYEYAQVYGSPPSDPATVLVGDPSTAIEATPVDFMMFTAATTPGQEAPTAREAAESFALEYSQSLQDPAQQLTREALDKNLFVEEKVGDLETCTISYLTMEGTTQEDSPQYWEYCFLSAGETTFLFLLVTAPRYATRNEVIFRDVLASFRLDSPSGQVE